MRDVSARMDGAIDNKKVSRDGRRSDYARFRLRLTGTAR